MASKADFTPEEWELLKQSPFEIVMGISAIGAGRLSGMAETHQELSTGMAQIVNLAQQFPGNTLLQEMLADIPDQDKLITYIEDHISQERFPLERTLDMSQQVARLLKERAAPAEAEEIKRYLFALAEDVAQAAGGVGGFQGFGRRKVSKVTDEERQALNKLSKALKLT